MKTERLNKICNHAPRQALRGRVAGGFSKSAVHSGNAFVRANTMSSSGTMAPADVILIQRAMGNKALDRMLQTRPNGQSTIQSIRPDNGEQKRGFTHPATDIATLLTPHARAKREWLVRATSISEEAFSSTSENNNVIRRSSRITPPPKFFGHSPVRYLQNCNTYLQSRVLLGEVLAEILAKKYAMLPNFIVPLSSKPIYQGTRGRWHSYSAYVDQVMSRPRSLGTLHQDSMSVDRHILVEFSQQRAQIDDIHLWKVTLIPRLGRRGLRLRPGSQPVPHNYSWWSGFDVRRELIGGALGMGMFNSALRCPWLYLW